MFEVYEIKGDYLENLSAEVQRVYLVDIYYLVAFGNYTFCFDAKHHVYILNNLIGEVMLSLPPEMFFRCHDSIIVGLMHVDKLLKKKQNCSIRIIQLKNKIRVGCARRKKKPFITALSAFRDKYEQLESEQMIAQNLLLQILSKLRTPGSNSSTFFSLS